MRVGLVSCVKSKRDRPAPAADLYTSPLFRGARCFVERSCDRWFVLSAEHGLLAPDRLTDPYERTLSTATRDERRAWSQRVLGQLENALGDAISGSAVEIHAGVAYEAFGLSEGLANRGATVELPLAGLRQGERLRFYKQHGCL
jgi:hypothetical protein